MADLPNPLIYVSKNGRKFTARTDADVADFKQKRYALVGSAPSQGEQFVSEAKLEERLASLPPGGGGTGYAKPVNGIPKTDLAPVVQASLDRAEDAYVSPPDGIPAAHLAVEVRSSLDKADVSGTYSKPAAGIPKSDLTGLVQSALDRANAAVRKVNGLSPDDTGNVTVSASGGTSFAEPVIYCNAQGVYPGRSTVSSDLTKPVTFSGHVEPPTGTDGMVERVDFWRQSVAPA